MDEMEGLRARIYGISVRPWPLSFPQTPPFPRCTPKSSGMSLPRAGSLKGGQDICACRQQQEGLQVAWQVDKIWRSAWKQGMQSGKWKFGTAGQATGRTEEDKVSSHDWNTLNVYVTLVSKACRQSRNSRASLCLPLKLPCKHETNRRYRLW